MKKILLIALLLSVGFCQQEYDGNDLIKMDNGLYTVKFSDEPITGKVYGYYGDVKPYKKVYIGNLIIGKKVGRWVDYYHNTGKKVYDENYKDGEKDGLWTWWYENGQKMRNMYFSTRNDKELFIEWYKNGIIRRKGHTNRENKEIGKWYFYNEKGSLIKVKDCDKEDCNKP